MDLNNMLSIQRLFFQSGLTKNVSYRKEQLRALEYALDRYEDALLAALQADLGKVPFEGFVTEAAIVREELRFALKHLDRWARPRRTLMPAAHFPARAKVVPEPKGIALIFSPWNYPAQLSLVPLVASIAAGNCTMLKPSRHSPQTSRLLIDMLSECYPPEYVLAIEGDDDTNDRLLSLPFDHIFFTGSPRVGRIVMEAAAKNLTPVTLELGGKSPCIVDETADIPIAARRIAWGKALNAGQTCVAPDYLLVQESVHDDLAACIAQSWYEFFGDAPCSSPDLPRIVSRRHYDRLKGMLGDGIALCGGIADDERLRIAPTLICDIRPDSPLLTEEIFGPILPIFTFETLDEAIVRVRRQPTPLALYLFSRSKAAERRVVQDVRFGGGCVNDTVIHLASPRVPFGGFGESGMGSYHGKRGFDELSHHKTIVKKHSRIDIRLRYPPHGEKKLPFARRLM